MNLFHACVWLDKTIKLLMKNHEIHLICSILRSECNNKYYEFISCLCMTEQNNELLIKNHETCPIGSTPFLEVNATTLDLYFHDRDHDIDYGHGYKGNFKNTFCHQEWHNNVKKEKRKCENIDKKDESMYYRYGGKDHLSCTYCTPKHLTNNEKNI